MSRDSHSSPAQKLQPAAWPRTKNIDSRYRIPGVLDNLDVAGLCLSSTGGPGEIAIEVVATGLNFIDVAKAMGIFPDSIRTSL